MRPHQNYLSLPSNEDFQPIMIELQNHQQKRDVDFKLIVLLILIIMLGILIRKQEEQLEVQSQIINELNLRREQQHLSPENIAQTYPYSQYQQQERLHNSGQYKANQQLQLKKDIRKYYKSHPINLQNMHNSLNKVTSEQSMYQKLHQKGQSIQTKSSNQVKNIQRNYKSSPKIQPPIQILLQSDNNNINQEQTINRNKPIISSTSTTSHSKLMKKYVQFYLWFPFFIFALIVYSCYQKQYKQQNSILISVKTLNQQQQEDGHQLNQCAICIAQITHFDPLAVLPCSQKHLFHSKCIKQWLIQKKTCPICRSDVRKFKNVNK